MKVENSRERKEAKALHSRNYRGLKKQRNEAMQAKLVALQAEALRLGAPPLLADPPRSTGWSGEDAGPSADASRMEKKAYAARQARKRAREYEAQLESALAAAEACVAVMTHAARGHAPGGEGEGKGEGKGEVRAATAPSPTPTASPADAARPATPSGYDDCIDIVGPWVEGID